MLLIVEKGNKSGICHAIHWNANVNNKYIKIYDEKKKKYHIGLISNLYGWAMSQQLPVDGIK